MFMKKLDQDIYTYHYAERKSIKLLFYQEI